MSILKVLEEQLIVGFTGRVNVLTEIGSEHLGNILLKDGQIVNGQYKKKTGRKAIDAICIDDVDGLKLRYVIEPEVIEDEQIKFLLSFDILKEEVRIKFQKFLELKPHRPPNDVKFVINESYLSADDEISNDEFKLLSCLTEYQTVENIYENTEMLNYEVTENLIKLKKKGAIKVYRARRA